MTTADPENTLEEMLLAEATAEHLEVPELDDAPPGPARFTVELLAAVEDDEQES